MKGTLFEAGAEIQLETQGEQWQQGDKIQGTFKVTNKTSSALKLDAMGVALAYVDLKKIKKSEKGAYKVLNQIDFDATTLKPGETISKDWSFILEENFFISDKKMCPYLFYGNLNKTLPSSLALKVEPHQIIRKVLEVWDVFFRFKCKEISSKKDQSLEIKLACPDAKDLLTLESLQLQVHRQKDILYWKYAAKKKSLGMSANGMNINLEDIHSTQEWPAKKYQLMPGHLDQEFAKAEINKVLEPLRKKAL